MPAEFDQRVREIFDQAMERPQGERATFLNSACQGNQKLHDAVERLLVARSGVSSFMNSAVQPALRIGRYLVQGELGRGGMGIVYDALDPVIGRNVAVKVINLKALSEPAEAEFLRDRLFREARSCGQLLHPGIVIVFDVGQEQQSAFIAMERVDGPSLQQMLATGKRLTADEALRILRQTAAALDYAHQHGIVHRDIKPANVMVRSDGTVKVTDFGIAKIISSATTTMTGTVMGTPSYMSPEQIEAREVDGRSDQFSLAVLAYEILTGAKPFQADSIPAIAHLIVYGARPLPHEVDANLPVGLDFVFQRAFSRLPEERFPTCVAFTDALQSAFEAPKPAPPPVVVLPASKKATGAVSALLLLVLLLLGGGGFYYFTYLRPKAQPTPAPEPTTTAESKPPAILTQTPPAAKTDQPAAPTGPPVIKKFKAEPDSVKNGTPAMLVWEVSGADKITIDHGVGKVGAKGMFAVLPALSTTYALTVSNAAGSTHKAAAIEVTPDPESVPRSVRARQLFDDAQTKRQEGQAEEAATLFGRSAEMGDASAMVVLAEMYSSGDGVAEDETKAFGWFKRAAEAGNVSGMVGLAGMYLLGVNGGDPNEEEAARWFQKAADHDSPAALFDLGQLYENGRGVGKSLDKAKDLYQRAAKLGNREAQKRLAALGVKN